MSPDTRRGSPPTCHHDFPRPDLAAKDLRTLDHTRPTPTTVPHTPQTHHEHVSTQQSVSNRSNWLEPGSNHHREIMLPCQYAPNGVTSPSTANDAMCLTCQVQGLPARTFRKHRCRQARQSSCLADSSLASRCACSGGRCLEVRRYGSCAGTGGGWAAASWPTWWRTGRAGGFCASPSTASQPMTSLIGGSKRWRDGR